MNIEILQKAIDLHLECEEDHDVPADVNEEISRIYNLLCKFGEAKTIELLGLV